MYNINAGNVCLSDILETIKSLVGIHGGNTIVTDFKISIDKDAKLNEEENN